MPPDSPAFYSKVFLVCKASGGLRPVRLKTTEHLHFHTSLLYAHNKLSAEYHKKRRLHIQNISAGCVLSCTNPSRLQEVPSFTFKIKVYQFRVFPFCLNTAPQVFTPLGHTVAAYLHRQGISVIQYLDNWLIHHPVSASKGSRIGRPQTKENPSWTHFRISRFSDFAYAWIKGEHHFQNQKLWR